TNRGSGTTSRDRRGDSSGPPPFPAPDQPVFGILDLAGKGEAVAAKGLVRGVFLGEGMGEGAGARGLGDGDEGGDGAAGMAASFMGREGHVGDLDLAGVVRRGLEGGDADRAGV